jgi:hypothetical protein
LCLGAWGLGAAGELVEHTSTAPVTTNNTHLLPNAAGTGGANEGGGREAAPSKLEVAKEIATLLLADRAIDEQVSGERRGMG